METAIPYALFLIACMALVWSIGSFFSVLTNAIIKAVEKKSGTASVTFEVVLAAISFTYIMGYIFLY